ncbi:MAG: ATP-binding protein [Candidatus Diapherotrites archaeon]|nr:ATP-binding protein [Candidatus Micrarchaeota archaeon]MBU1939544.1 ATP-binding protein [Candidatus Micrarchaeota archaeon]
MPPSNSGQAKIPANYKSTAEINVSEKIIGQVIGQESSVELIRKAAAQKRNVLLIGVPGTGKSMLAQAMAEIMPISRLHDVLVYPNEEDSNNPKIRSVPAGQGKKILEQSRLENKKMDDNMRLMGLILPIGWFLLSWLMWNLGFLPDVVYAATLVLGGFLVIGFALGTQMKAKSVNAVPKLLINNAGKKIAPFVEATGARAGALLGDVRHDPLQCHFPENTLFIREGNKFIENKFSELWAEMYEKYSKDIIKNEKGYEAIMLPDEEKVYTLGYKDGKVVLSRILSLNRRLFEGELVDLKAGGRTVTLTPEHKVFVSKGDKKAEAVSVFDNVLKLTGSSCG